jgi:membrane protein YfhO
VRALNVKYILTDGYYPDTTGDLSLRHDGPVKVYEVKGAAPRAYLVHQILRTRDQSGALAILAASPALGPGMMTAWAGPPPSVRLAPPAEPDSVLRLRYDLNESEYLVRTSTPAIFVQVDQYDPDWRATIDGKPAVIHRVNYLMRGIEIPAGVHRVRLVYMPAALEAGIRISLASAAATILLGLGGFLLGRRARRGAPAAGTA